MRTIDSLLVANRGEIARRIMRTARSRGIRTVAVYVAADADAPYVREADEAVFLATDYLDGDAVVAAATLAGADAIHPGYGFLSENAQFASATIAAGLSWVGPPPTAIAQMGDKIAAKRAAVEAGVPTLPSTEDPADADRIGYPLLVKAAAGGGGKGMRVVSEATQLADAVAAAQREALGAFGDATVFLERYVARARHVEIQIIADSFGNVVHLGERECSIQRRHQKVIEESPSPVVDADLRESMGRAAVDLARSLGYENAGTVEFLLDDETRRFYFLEVNTRLQVEHPVTESVTGLDLVGLQLDVAAGNALPFDQGPPLRGHAIEARLYAEDVDAGFLPATGTLSAYRPTGEPTIRWDSGVEAGSVIGLNFDPMLAKVIAYDPESRSAAARKLAAALERTHLGGVTTNRDFLVSVLRSPEFHAGATTTDFIDVTELKSTDAKPREAAIVAALWLEGKRRSEAAVLATLPSGWRNSPMPAQSATFTHGNAEIEVTYVRSQDGTYVCDGCEAIVHTRADDGLDIAIDGRRWFATVTDTETQIHVQTSRTTVALTKVPRFIAPSAATPTGALIAPMPGSVVEVRCSPGDRVEPQQILVLLEAMKMEHHVRSPTAGVVQEIMVAAGQQVENGAVLLVMDPTMDADE